MLDHVQNFRSSNRFKYITGLHLYKKKKIE